MAQLKVWLNSGRVMDAVNVRLNRICEGPQYIAGKVKYE